MSVRSGRVVKTVRTITRPAPEATCAFTTYSCTHPRLEGYEYCSRHILEDKSAPYRQCNYVFTSTGKRCLRAAPTTDRKEGLRRPHWPRYCLDHSRRSLVVRQRAARKTCPRQTPETLLSMLSHHQMDTQTAGQNAIPDPASVAGLAASALEYASDTDSEEETLTFPHDSLPRREADSELDSADSDVDPLEHAEVFTTEEITRIYLEKLQKLKSMYVGEYKRLIHIMRESRRKYLQSVRVEKETMASIHDQPKPTPEERDAYEQLKALARYHKHLSSHSLLHRQQLERRLQVTEGVNYKPGTSIGCVKCVYSEGSWKCGEKSVPLSKYCSKHILHDPNQVLFGACGVGKCEDDQCSIPVISLPYGNTCIYHTPVPDPIPVSSSLVEEAESGQPGFEEDFYGQGSYSDFPPTDPPNIIDLPESHSFIVTEVPPDNVMEDDDTPMDNAEGGTQETTKQEQQQDPPAAVGNDPSPGGVKKDHVLESTEAMQGSEKTEESTSLKVDESTCKAQESTTDENNESTSKEVRESTSKAEESSSKAEESTSKAEESTSKAEESTSKTEDSTSKMEDSTSEKKKGSTCEKMQEISSQESTSRVEDSTSEKMEESTKQENNQMEESTSDKKDESTTNNNASESITTTSTTTTTTTTTTTPTTTTTDKTPETTMAKTEEDKIEGDTLEVKNKSQDIQEKMDPVEKMEVDS